MTRSGLFYTKGDRRIELIHDNDRFLVPMAARERLIN